MNTKVIKTKDRTIFKSIDEIVETPVCSYYKK